MTHFPRLRLAARQTVTVRRLAEQVRQLLEENATLAESQHARAYATMKAELAVATAAMTVMQRHFALAIAQRERARDLAIAAEERADEADALAVASMLDVRAGFGLE